MKSSPILRDEQIKPVHLVSLGAGVQSSTMAMMAAAGEITPMPTAAIFADTQAEPASVYRWLDWLETQLPFPVYRVTKGSLEADETRIRTSAKSGARYMKGSIPAFVKNTETGKIGLLGRKCTEDYKIVPIQKKVRELVGIARGGAGVVRAVMWIGVSTDESQRMKHSLVDYIENYWPLIRLRMSRQHCLDWMAARGFPIPPRSACHFCPFHTDKEWSRLRNDEPEEFARSVEFDRSLRVAAENQDVLRGKPYLHRSCKPLDQVDFRSDVERGQQLLNWQDECTGMCGN